MSYVQPVQFVALSQQDAQSQAAMHEMALRLRRMLETEGLEGFRRSQRIHGRFFIEYQAALVSYDRYIAHIIATEPLAISCRAGCAACCRHELARGVTPVEILAIYRLVRSWPDIGVLYEACGDNAVAFQGLLSAELSADPRPLEDADPRVLAAHLAYNRLERPCAFLDTEQGRCRIYPVRPLVCRWFYNLSPADWCRPSHAKYLERDAVGIDPYREINELMGAISLRLGIETLNYLSGAFVHIAGDILRGQSLNEQGSER